MRKRVLFIANSLDNAYKFQRVLSELGVEIAAGSSERLKTLFAPGMDPDLVKDPAQVEHHVCHAAKDQACND